MSDIQFEKLQKKLLITKQQSCNALIIQQPVALGEMIFAQKMYSIYSDNNDFNAFLKTL
jgi:hypothetical protein